MNKFKRIILNLMYPSFIVKYKFPQQVLNELESYIATSEKNHFGQIKFVIESNLSISQILNNTTTKERALEWFGKLGVWDTEYNSGILIYILFADKEIEIITDRGINKLISDQEVETICNNISRYFEKEEYIQGLKKGLSEVDVLLTSHFPKQHMNYNDEISNEVILK